MNSWLSKLKISAALDQSPARQTADQEVSSEFADFRARLQALDRALRGGPPPVELPSGLHGGILAAVRSSGPAASPTRLPGYRWALGGALACFLLCGLWAGSHLLRSRLAPSPFTSAASARLNQQVAALPTAVLSPLSREWQALNLDFEKTADFILASMP